MKPSFMLKLVSLLVWLALACAEEAMPVRSVGSGDGDGDGDEGDGDGDGESDEGDGDGDGDEPARFVESERIPVPDDSVSWTVLALNNEGHVLIGSIVSGGGGREMIWRGGDDFVEVQPPQGWAFASHFESRARCLFDDGRVVTYIFDASLIDVIVVVALLDDGISIGVDGLGAPLDCNGAGQGVTSSGIWGSGAFQPFAEGIDNDVVGMNAAGALALRSGFWEDGVFTAYDDELFKVYHGPSGSGLVLGTNDELAGDEQAVLWSAETGKIETMLPRLPNDNTPTPGPHLISENGDVVVGTNVRSEDGNEVYLRRGGHYYVLGVSGIDIANPIDINDRSQVLCPKPYNVDQNEYVGVLFTPQD